MEPKVFLRNSLGFLGMAMLTPKLLKATHATNVSTAEDLDCTVTNSETAGPFPTINPSSYETGKITGDRTGVAFTMNVYIKDKNASCAAYQNCLVDIWHCDKDGNYSQDGGTGMQPTNYTSYNFLLENASNVSLTVFDIAARQIGTAKKYSLNAGSNNISINTSEYGLSS